MCKRAIIRNVLSRLTMVFLLISCILARAAEADATSEFNRKMQKMQEKVQACGSDINCLQKANTEIQALTNEYMKSTKSPGGTGLQAGQHEPCAGYPAAGYSCVPVKIFVTITEEMKQTEHYCEPEGVLPCNQQNYISRYLLFSYTAEAVGEVRYKKDFAEFQIQAQGTAAQTRIKQLHGFTNRYTKEGAHAKRIWHRENYPTGRVKVRRPFKIGVFHPPGREGTNNLCFEPVEIESQKESENWLLGTGTSKLCWNHPTVRFSLTPAMMKEMMAKKVFQKTFHWRDSQPGGKSTADNFIDIKMEIGKGRQAPAEEPLRFEPAPRIVLFEYRETVPGPKPNKKPCDIVKQDLGEAKKLRDAFKDPKLLERAKKEDWDGERYKQEAYKKVYGSSSETYESPMGTDPTTCIIKKRWKKEDYQKKGYPEVCYDADLAHEKVHEANCKKKKNPMEYDADMSFPDKLSKEEISAYGVKIKYLENWLKKNCK